ncbi:ABC transporter permease [Legionella oakridgensis]|uniref:Transport permease protein n=2 Tax=Legionella oakridgensis TaxID=29423 RepID=W0B518_9GAMM|nr:ABC transporter permease [Legionella oakridgensis]AHE65618.1 ABC-type polysaccharide/polyol phosphate export systems, permease component [Legionella oakridgensis ATCC 33761 = DSM 21215]KTD38288.1 Polysialic acid transport protein KpsM [Legionella oakridgensis]STY15580.1 Polysialic acid transport protein kpsM [Legionella longbeachae]
MVQHGRASWQVMCASVFAIVIRDIQKKFIKSVNTPRSLAFFWIILEPMLHIGAWMLIRTLVRHSTTHTPLSPSLFIVLGAIPFFLFRNVINSAKSSIKGNKSYYLFRQIKPIDPILANLISELLINTAVFIVILAILSWFSISWHVYDFLFWLINIATYVAFLLGLALIIAILCFFFNFINICMSIIMRLAYLFSGIFFSAATLPEQARTIMLYNPVFQFIELTRECFMPAYSYIPYASSAYLFKSSLIILMLGSGIYLSMYHKIMREIEQR